MNIVKYSTQRCVRRYAAHICHRRLRARKRIPSQSPKRDGCMPASLILEQGTTDIQQSRPVDNIRVLVDNHINTYPYMKQRRHQRWTFVHPKVTDGFDARQATKVRRRQPRAVIHPEAVDVPHAEKTAEINSDEGWRIAHPATTNRPECRHPTEVDGDKGLALA